MLGELLTAIVTPFTPEGAIDLGHFRSLASFLVENGSDGIVVAGTTGECPTLTDAERGALVRAAVEEVGDRATVLVGTGTYSTAHSVDLTRQAHALGADGFLVVTPYYSRPPARGIVAHFEAIAAVSDRPIVVYNIPQRCVINIEPETMARLAEIPNVMAVKQATPEIDQARWIVELGLDLYAGNDDLLLPFLEVGGIGVISVFSHLVGPQVRELIRRYGSGDRNGARRLNEELMAVNDMLAATTNPIGLKAALNLLGHEVGGLRLPLVEATELEAAAIRSALQRVGLLAAAHA
jgi:4-hydroxy-tetrahydrodipicolinate synthase